MNWNDDYVQHAEPRDVEVKGREFSISTLLLYQSWGRMDFLLTRDSMSSVRMFGIGSRAGISSWGLSLNEA